MKNLKKGVTLFAMVMLLAACGGAKKQKQISAKEAEEVAEKICDAMDGDELPFKTPDACTVVYEMKEEMYETQGEMSMEYSGGIKITVHYSKAKNIYYYEQVSYSEENGEREEQKQCQWVLEEDDKISAYIMMVDEEGKALYGYESDNDTKLEDFAAEQFANYNVNFVGESLESFMYMEGEPSIEGLPDSAEVSYKTYYGSANEGSIQMEEKLNIKADDYVTEEGHMFGKQVSSVEVVIEDYILKSFSGVDSMDAGKTDKSATFGESSKMSYTFSGYKGAPKLNKDLWKDVLAAK